jgi:hypothetical protein
LKGQKRHQKKKPVIPSIMVGIEVEIGIILNVMVGVGVIKTIEVMEIKIARTKTNQKQTTKRKVATLVVDTIEPLPSNDIHLILFT